MRSSVIYIAYTERNGARTARSFDSLAQGIADVEMTPPSVDVVGWEKFIDGVPRPVVHEEYKAAYALARDLVHEIEKTPEVRSFTVYLKAPSTYASHRRFWLTTAPMKYLEPISRDMFAQYGERVEIEDQAGHPIPLSVAAQAS